MKPITFFVPGIPRPAGSKRAFAHKSTGNIVVTDSSGKKGKDWRGDVKRYADEATKGLSLLDGPVSVCMTFFFPRPKGHFGTGRNADKIKDSAPEFPTGKPDLLKVARAVEDAMSGIVYRDDALIVDEILKKRYVRLLQPKPGVHVEVSVE